MRLWKIKVRRFINRTYLYLLGYKFVESAITYFNENGTLVEVTGKRHPDCLKTIQQRGQTDLYKQWYEDGFTIKIRSGFGFSAPLFISRENATILCKKHRVKLIGAVLTSEDLW